MLIAAEAEKIRVRVRVGIRGRAEFGLEGWVMVDGLGFGVGVQK